VTLFTFGRSAAASAVFLLLPAGSLPADAPSNEVAATPESLVARALRSELSGPSPLRRQLLTEALRHEEGFAPARWHSGYVKRGGRWMSVDDVALDSPEHKRLAEYRRRRAAMISTAAEHRELATWCAGHGLPDEARLHWTKVLQFGPDAQAMAALGLHDDQASQRAPNDAAGRRAAKTWRPVVTAWRDAIVRGTKAEAEDATAQLGRLSDPDAIPALGEAFLQPRAKGRLPILFVETVSRLPGPEATTALLPIAAWHASAHLRGLALASLKKRPKYAVVPLLLAAFARPVDSATSIHLAPDGSVVRNHVVRMRGWTDDAMLQSQRQWTVFGKPNDRLRGQVLLDAAQDAQRTERETALYAARVAAHNSRIQAVLAEIMEIQDATDPVGWYERWLRYCEYDRPDVPRDINYQSFADVLYVIAPPEPPPRPEPPPPPPRTYSCFPAGTLVATLDGQRAIETIKPGDRVLSQDVETGRLDYPLVYDVTRRPPAAMIRVGLGPETIAATRGHLFWVNGRAWVMAKQLEVGMVLHGLRGAVTVDSVEPASGRPAYNLVVGGTNTYFVGDQRVLVHDNMPAIEATTIVPGLAASSGPIASAP
jgi:hypothetical protein